MKKIIVLVGASALVAAVPALAAKPPHPPHPSKGMGNTCTARNEGYNARGKLVSGTLTPGTKKGHFDGVLTVDVRYANHRAPRGSQTFTLTDARVNFDSGVTATTIAPGDHVALHGKIRALPKKCSSAGFTRTITVKHTTIRAPK